MAEARTSDGRMLEFLRDIVRIDSTPGQEERVVHRIAKEMEELGYVEARVDEAGNAVGRLGSGSPTVLIDCHVDTIPMHSAGRWKHDPLGADLEGGRLFGLGVCDMKSSAAASIYGAARLFAGNPPLGTVYVVSSIAEEMMEGAALASTFDRCNPDATVIGEPTDLRLCIGQRGRAKLEVDVVGEACHAGHPEIGINAASWMARLVNDVARLEHPNHPVLGGRSVTLIDIHSEPYPSVSMVPATCRARFDCRFGPEETEQSLVRLVTGLTSDWNRDSRAPRVDCHIDVAEFQTFSGRSYRVPEYAPAWLMAPDSDVVRAGAAGLVGAGLPAEIATYGFCTNGSLTAGLRGTPTIGYGVGREADAHTVDEHIDVANLYRAATGYAAIVRALLGAPIGRQNRST
ncbi:MAG: YgeY family selenium metabolism-linked hydrolase [Candidatus Dormibacterales bacterium]